MQKTRTVKRTVEETIVDEVVCNSCGSHIHQGWRKGENHNFEPECITVDHTWGYYSKKDMTKHMAHICEICWARIEFRFAVPVTKTDTLSPHEEVEEEELIDLSEGDCGDGKHGPWCREWDSMKFRAEKLESCNSTLEKLATDLESANRTLDARILQLEKERDTLGELAANSEEAFKRLRESKYEAAEDFVSFRSALRRMVKRWSESEDYGSANLCASELRAFLGT
jgi:hypothetical protein